MSEEFALECEQQYERECAKMAEAERRRERNEEAARATVFGEDDVDAEEDVIGELRSRIEHLESVVATLLDTMQRIGRAFQ